MPADNACAGCAICNDVCVYTAQPDLQLREESIEDQASLQVCYYSTNNITAA